LNEILSQEEINALLDAMSKGEILDEGGEKATKVIKKTVVPYDFKNTAKVSKEQLSTLRAMHKNFARTFSTSLSGMLKTIAEVDCTSADISTYGEFFMSFLNPSCFAIIAGAPLKGTAVLELPAKLVFLIIDRLLGGLGIPYSEIRNLTEIEKSIITKVINRLIEDLQTVWKHLFNVTFEVKGLESEPFFVQTAPSAEAVILIIFNVKVGTISDIMNLCFPLTMIEPALAKKTDAERLLNSSAINNHDEDYDKTSSSIIHEHLTRTEVTVRARFESSPISLHDLIELRVGDIIKLDKPKDSPSIIEIDGRAKFLGKPGVIRGRKGVQISSFIEG